MYVLPRFELVAGGQTFKSARRKVVMPPESLYPSLSSSSANILVISASGLGHLSKSDRNTSF